MNRLATMRVKMLLIAGACLWLSGFFAAWVFFH